MAAQHQSEFTTSTPTFSLNLVQLSGKATLLGAECVTWRFADRSLSVVSGGNGSGKSLLCAAIRVAAFPGQSESLRLSLFDAGLFTVTVAGLLGNERKEWTVELESGEIRQRANPGDAKTLTSPISEIVFRDLPVLDQLPHIVVNGQWHVPVDAQLKWASEMLCVPVERELEAWETRLERLEHGDNHNVPASIISEIEQVDAQLAHAESLRNSGQAAELASAELQQRITECEMMLHVVSAEETELVAKIEIAERAVHLEGWAKELRQSWDSVESVRTRFAQLQERLEELQDASRGWPDNVREIAHEYLRLNGEREAAAQRLRESEQKVHELEERRRALSDERAQLLSRTDDDVTDRIEKLHRESEKRERDLTELSRNRIDLLRRRDSLERQCTEKYRDLTALSPEEWNAVDAYLTNFDEERVSAHLGEIQKLHAELVRINDRLGREFAGYEKLSVETPVRLEKLYSIREAITKRETDLNALRGKIVELQARKNGSGTKSMLSFVGTVAAGIPAGLLLGWDIGFFGAVLGGGAGFGIGQMLAPKPDVSHEEYVRKIEVLQQEQQEALATREALRLELVRFREHLRLDEALGLWQEFTRLTERRNAIEAKIAESESVSADHLEDGLPAVLRNLDREEIQRRVTEYRALASELAKTTEELNNFNQPGGPGASIADAERSVGHLKEEIAALEESILETTKDRERRHTVLTNELAAIEHSFSQLPDIGAEQAALRTLIESLERLDLSVGGVFGQKGVDSVLMTIDDLSRLQVELRETKSQLSTGHSPQELAIRTRLVDDELEQVSARLRDLDPLFGTLETRGEALEKYRNQMEQLFQQRAANERKIADLRLEIENLRLPELIRRINELPAESLLLHNRATAQARLEEIQRSIQAAHEMCSTLSTELSDQRTNAPVRLHNLMQSCVLEAIGERFTSVEYENGQWHVVSDDGVRRPLSTLSRGIGELVTFCLNVGLLFATNGSERAPVLWDDVLSQLDDHHLSVAKGLIDMLARERQIILLTRDARMRAWGKPADLLVGRHELSGLLN